MACVDTGRMAFIQAESEMGRINLISANVYHTVFWSQSQVMQVI